MLSIKDILNVCLVDLIEGRDLVPSGKKKKITVTNVTQTGSFYLTLRRDSLGDKEAGRKYIDI